MDVFLCATCSFFIGTNSGLGLVPPAFGVPCVLTNWSPIAIPQWYPQDLFVPKLVRSDRDNRLLTFEELYATPAGWKQFEEYFSDHGLRVIDNTPDELRDVVVEMFERVSGAASYTADDERRRAEFERLAAHYTGYVGSRIGRDFLKEHYGLLGLTFARTPAVLAPVAATVHERAG
jgi:putative glycosyltransferase (TIGR04372 family)